LWSEQWHSLESRLRALEDTLRQRRSVALRGGIFSRWDLQVPGGALGAVRLRTMIEEHSQGRQYVRFFIWPTFSPIGLLALGVLGALAIWAGLAQARVADVILGLTGILIGITMLLEASRATAALRSALKRSQQQLSAEPPRVSIHLDEPSAARTPGLLHALPSHSEAHENRS
jgi:hypothetical protein